MSARLYSGEALAVLATLPSGSVQTCVTSPPYWGLRDYGMDGQLGLEATPAAYVARLVGIFAAARRVLTEDGTLWLNLGDSYAGGGRGGNPDDSPFDKQASNRGSLSVGPSAHIVGIGAKNLVGIPWRVAFALQADGWYLRSEIIWSKPNPMPESVTDRPTKAHETVFLLSKSARYYYDAAAIAEPVAMSTVERLGQPTLASQRGSDRVPGKTNGRMKAERPRFVDARNARTVWTIATQPYTGAHFATMPPELARRCIAAGSRPRDTVLDPFGGSGTTAATAVGMGRNAIHIDLNPAYNQLARDRIGPMLCEIVA